MSHHYADIITDNCQPLQPLATDVEPRLQSLNEIRAILFDVYGTLLISASGDIGANDGDHRLAAIDRCCQLFDLELAVSPAEALTRLEDEVKRVHATAKAEGVAYPEVDIVEIWQAVLPQIAKNAVENVGFSRFSLEYEVRVNPVWPMPDTATMLSQLGGSELVLGIVSNAQFFTPLLFPALVGKALEDFGFVAELMYFSYEHRQAKPGNFLYRLASEQLQSQGIAPANVLYVGNDMLNDIAAAASVGFRTALFAGDQRSLRWRRGDERVTGVVPDIVITQLTQLHECLTV